MKIIRPYLAVGGLRDTHDLRLLRDHNIGAMLQIAERVKHPGVETAFLPIEDGEPLTARTVDKAVAFVREHRDAGRVTLVACAFGVSRSVTLATAAIKEIENVSLAEAYALVKGAHADAQPHIVLWLSLCKRYNENPSYLETVVRAKSGTGDALATPDE